MGSLSAELMHRTDEIVQKWFEAWKRSRHPHPELTEAVLKDRLAVQLRIVGEQLEALNEGAEAPETMWKTADRLDPEARVDQDVPIEEVVQEYRIAVGAVRAWVDEQGIEVSFREYSYLFEAMFELTAEAVRRYAAYQAEQVSKERSEYLAGLAHQLRAPLQVILLQARRLEDPRHRSDAKVIGALQRSVRRMKFMVDGVMRLERFKPEEMPVRPRRIRLAELVDQVIADNDLEASQKGLRLEAELDPALAMDVDPDLFVDTLGNLVQNAVKYTSSGYVRVAVTVEPDEIVFEVCDSGPGISAERQQALFSPVTPSKPGGVGIGLAVAGRAVKAQGGTIGVESGPKTGSRFWFRLPKSVAPRDEPPSSDEQHA